MQSMLMDRARPRRAWHVAIATAFGVPDETAEYYITCAKQVVL